MPILFRPESGSDATSEVRYLVLPQQPEGTENWSAKDLEILVTRNSMIGVELAKQPQQMRTNP